MNALRNAELERARALGFKQGIDECTKLLHVASDMHGMRAEKHVAPISTIDRGIAQYLVDLSKTFSALVMPGGTPK